MNSWLKLALYSFIGIIIGSFILGIIAPNSGMNNNMGPMGNMGNGYYDHSHGRGMGQMPMGNGSMMQGGMGMGMGMGGM